ncbi:MAG: hypothetical protein LBU21_08130, partial [Treponema sp.]|nr:hypothetical protein [Treponema sp.]
MIRVNTNHGQLAVLWEHIKSGEGNPHFRRIYAELRYLCALSDSRGGAWDGLLRKAAETLAAEIDAAGAATPGAVKKIEDSLS